VEGEAKVRKVDEVRVAERHRHDSWIAPVDTRDHGEGERQIVDRARHGSVAPEPERRASARHRGALAPAAAAGRACEVVGVSRDAVDKVVCLVGEREIGAVRLADHDRARCPEPLDGGRILLGDECRTSLRPACRHDANRFERILDRDGDAV
jgi:hypothetical protein